ncbi:MAG: dipeptidase [Firmicutes bacterium]|nr:dipeptidase [Bacillota bacterium]
MWISDTHCDALTRMGDQPVDLRVEQPDRHIDLPRLFAGQVGLQTFAMWVPQHAKPFGLRDVLVHEWTLFKHAIASLPEVEWVRSREQVREPSRGHLLALLSIEGVGSAGAPEWLELFFEAGVRMVSLVWNERNELADGAGQPHPGGLTEAGIAAVEKIESLGMVLDVSHLSDPSFWDVIRFSHRPLLASHSNARRLCPHRRNLSDEALRAIADRGGVVSVTMEPDFLRIDGQASLQDIVDQVCYLRNLIGSEAIGFGADFDGVDTLPQGVQGPDAYPRILQALQQAGIAENELEAMAHGNHERLLREVLPSENVA